jgi:hypothetical protein
MQGKIKATMKLADFLAQATGRQLNRLGDKLGMNKDILDGMSENQVKGAILDESQKYMRNKRKNINRRVGAAAAGGAATYGVVDFIHDMLGISSVADGTLSAAERSKGTDEKFGEKTKPTAPRESKKDDMPKSKPKPKPKRKPMPKTLPKPKPKRQKKEDSGVTFQFETVNKNKGGSVTKSSKGAQDFRKGGMVLSTVDNRKKR